MTHDGLTREAGFTACPHAIASYQSLITPVWVLLRLVCTCRLRLRAFASAWSCSLSLHHRPLSTYSYLFPPFHSHWPSSLIFPSSHHQRCSVGTIMASITQTRQAAAQDLFTLEPPQDNGYGCHCPQQRQNDGQLKPSPQKRYLSHLRYVTRPFEIMSPRDRKKSEVQDI